MPSSRSRSLWILLAAAALVAIGAFMFPALVIRPFAYQNPRALWWAMAIRQRAPIVSPLFALPCFALVALLWNRYGKWRKALLALILVPVSLCAVMSRLNYFEWMFHPVDSARFEPASANKLDKGEMILAVNFGSDARAYPIREMAYHHILNDVVNGVPVAVTY